MAMTTNLPPQAYTRDTLVKAIEWLSSQPLAVREKANSADLIVSHYLQACRRAVSQMDAPVSGEAFKADLKHLAEDLKQFERPQAPEPVITPPSPPQHTPNRFFSPGLIEEPTTPRAPTWEIDTRSLAVAREIQQRLNLGSEIEAIRLLITLGAEKAKSLF